MFRYTLQNKAVPANRDGKVEEGEHLASGVLDEHVGDEGGGHGGVARLPCKQKIFILGTKYQ